MNNYQILRQSFLIENGFTNAPAVRLAYDKCMLDSMTEENIAKSLKKQGY